MGVGCLISKLSKCVLTVRLRTPEAVILTGSRLFSLLSNSGNENITMQHDKRGMDVKIHPPMRWRNVIGKVTPYENDAVAFQTSCPEAAESLFNHTTNETAVTDIALLLPPTHRIRAGKRKVW